MDVVWHGDEGMEFVEALGSVVLEDFKEEICGRFDLKEAAAIGSDRGDEECAAGRGSWRLCHRWSLLTVRKKAK